MWDPVRVRPLLMMLVAGVVALSGVVALDVAAPHSATGADATLIDFEETFTQPGPITSQYCNDPVSNVGVEFLEPVRLIEPTVGTYTPTHAATNDFGVEFSELDVMQIGFTAGQSFISIRVGLDRPYPFPVTARLRAYTSASPTGTPILNDHVVLGQVATSISQQLYVSTDGGAATIRSIEIAFDGAAAGNGAFEVVDNLLFPTAGPLCVTDLTAPVVQITAPAFGEPVYASAGGGPGKVGVAFTAEDQESGIAYVEVLWLGAGTQLGKFAVCGGPTVPPCSAGTTVARDFWTWAPSGTDTLYVYAFNPGGLPGYDFRTFNVAPSTVNVWARGLEVTQATQPWVAEATTSRKAGGSPWFGYPATPTSVPLVADRRTVARFFVGVEGLATGAAELGGVGGELRCGRDPDLVLACPGPSVVYPTDDAAKGVTKTISVDPTETLNDQRVDAAKTLNFVLPAEWTGAGTIHLEARVSAPVPQCVGCADGADAIRITSIPFRPVPAWNQSVVQVLVERNGTLTATQAERDAAVQYIRATYPIDDTTIPGAWRHYPYLVLLLPGMNPDTSELLADLASSYGFMLENHGYEAVWAITDSTAPGWQSLARLDGFASSNGGGATSGAHEVGHALGLLHAGNPPGHGKECVPEKFCNTDWPWLHGGLGAFGFDVFEFDVKDPGNPPDPGHYNDLMSYGDPEWISPRTWIRVFNQLADAAFPYPKKTAAATATMAVTMDGDELPEATPVEQLLVRGNFNTEANSWSLDPLYLIEMVETAIAPITGDYLIEVRDADGGLLSEQWVTVPLLHIDTDDPNVMPIPDPSFIESVPVRGEPHMLTISDGETLLSSVTRSEHQPEVAVVEPAGGVFDGTVRWEWSDEDGDDLSVMVDYLASPGGEPMPLAIDYRDDVLSLDPALLPGGAEARIRLRVTDGFNTTTVVSEPFTVADKPPHVEIISPQNDRLIDAGDRLELRGGAADPEDGPLTATSLIWTSDRDGLLGVGNMLGVATLTPGVHRIWLEANDGAGNAAIAEVIVEVVVRAVRNTQPIADAGADVVVGEPGVVRLDGTGSSDVDGDLLTFVWRIVDGPGGGSLDDDTSARPRLTVAEPGVYFIELVVHDGELGSLPAAVTIEVDAEPPEVELVFPGEAGISVVGAVEFIVDVADGGGGTAAVRFSIRDDDGSTGIPIGLDDLAAEPHPADGTWRHTFDSAQVPDGRYLLTVGAEDVFGNVTTTEPTTFFVRNWVVTKLSPNSKTLRAGRTIPVKFSLRMAAMADPDTPFVHVEDLLVRISSEGVVVFEAAYGRGRQGYRINDAAERYATRFKTSRLPAHYAVEVMRAGVVLGDFEFDTVRR